MRRLDNIIKKDGQTVIVAMDHGLALDVVPTLNDTGEVLKKIVEGGADAIITTFGIAKKYEDILSQTGLILRLDGGNTDFTKKIDRSLLYSVEDAVRLGADGVVCMGFPGADNEDQTLSNLAEVASQCDKWNIPLIAEMLPGGFGEDIPNSVENIKFVARIGSEMGADIIKTSFIGNESEFKKVIDGSFSPVVILGGDKVDSISDLLMIIEKAIEIGGSGVAIGRNVWKHENPYKMTKALVDLVHGNKSAEEIGKLLKR